MNKKSFKVYGNTIRSLYYGTLLWEAPMQVSFLFFFWWNMNFWTRFNRFRNKYRQVCKPIVFCDSKSHIVFSLNLIYSNLWLVLQGENHPYRRLIQEDDVGTTIPRVLNLSYESMPNAHSVPFISENARCTNVYDNQNLFRRQHVCVRPTEIVNWKWHNHYNLRHFQWRKRY